MSMIASSRERKRSVCPLSRRSIGRIVPSDATEGITTRDSTESQKTKLQAFAPSTPKSLQSQMPPRLENRLPLNGLRHFHGRRISMLTFGTGRSNTLFGLVHMVVFAVFVFMVFVP
jgi:hypothetical protein